MVAGAKDSCLARDRQSARPSSVVRNRPATSSLSMSGSQPYGRNGTAKMRRPKSPTTETDTRAAPRNHRTVATSGRMRHQRLPPSIPEHLPGTRRPATDGSEREFAVFVV
jgi:hypothetical protein